MPESNFLKPSTPSTLAAATVGTGVNTRTTSRIAKITPQKCAVEVSALPTASLAQFELVCIVPGNTTPQVVARTAVIPQAGTTIGQFFPFNLIAPYQSEFIPPIGSVFTIRVAVADTTLVVVPFFALSYGDS